MAKKKAKSVKKETRVVEENVILNDEDENVSEEENKGTKETVEISDEDAEEKDGKSLEGEKADEAETLEVIKNINQEQAEEEIIASGEDESQKDVVIIIPSFNPDDKLIKTIDGLKEADFENIIVVDDGSADEAQSIFDEIKDKVQIVKHSVNLGKGRAIKTAINHTLLNFKNIEGVIFVDDDGQHEVSAVTDVKNALIQNPEKLILGVRNLWKSKNVPVSNLLGNKITIAVFLGLTQILYGDTQCGLRGVPFTLLKTMAEVEGERYEYENVMLLDVRRRSIDFVEVPINAVYLKGNKSSSFNKVKDSTRIYKSILSFALFPAITGLISCVFCYYFMKWFGSAGPFNPIIIYAQGLLIVWIIFSGSMKETQLVSVFNVVLVIALSTFLFYIIYASSERFVYSWWLSAIVVGPINYVIYMRYRYSKPPVKTKYKK